MEEQLSVSQASAKNITISSLQNIEFTFLIVEQLVTILPVQSNKVILNTIKI